MISGLAHHACNFEWHNVDILCLGVTLCVSPWVLLTYTNSKYFAQDLTTSHTLLTHSAVLILFLRITYLAWEKFKTTICELSDQGQVNNCKIVTNVCWWEPTEREERERGRSLISQNTVSQLSSYLVQGDARWGNSRDTENSWSPIMITNIRLVFATSGCDKDTKCSIMSLFF